MVAIRGKPAPGTTGNHRKKYLGLKTTVMINSYIALWLTLALGAVCITIFVCGNEPLFQDPSNVSP